MNTKEYAQRIKNQVNNATLRQEQRQLEPHLPDQALQQILETKTAIFNAEDAELIEKLVNDKQANTQLRAAAVSRLGFGDDARVNLTGLIALLNDPSEASEVKLKAVLKLEDAAFERPDFEDYRPDYLSALRSCLTANDEDLIYTVMTTLSANKDPYAQEVLLKWVEDQDVSPLATGTVLQLLGNDIHAGLYKVARNLLSKPIDENTRIEALRILASDGESYEYFNTMIQNKQEPIEARQIAAAALKSLNPEQFEVQALSMIEDEDEDDTMRAMVLSGLTHSVGFDTNQGLRDKVQAACDCCNSEHIKSLAHKQLALSGGAADKSHHDKHR